MHSLQDLDDPFHGMKIKSLSEAQRIQASLVGYSRSIQALADSPASEKYKEVLRRYPTCVFVKKYGDSGRGEVIGLLDTDTHEELTIFV